MSTKTTLENRSMVRLIVSSDQQSIQKRPFSEEPNTVFKKKKKTSIDITSYWKHIHKIFEKNAIKIFECKSKNECKDK